MGQILYLYPMQGPGTVFNPEKKTEGFHEAKYQVFLQMGEHQREYRYQCIEQTIKYFSTVLFTQLIDNWYFSNLALSET